MSASQQPHLDAICHILRYINNTKHYDILYPKLNPTIITGFTDVDWEADIETWQSTSGYRFMMDSRPITWQSKRL
jgi:hypothetical protein